MGSGDGGNTAEMGTPRVNPIPADRPMKRPMLDGRTEVSLMSHTYAWRGQRERGTGIQRRKSGRGRGRERAVHG